MEHVTTYVQIGVALYLILGVAFDFKLSAGRRLAFALAWPLALLYALVLYTGYSILYLTTRKFR